MIEPVQSDQQTMTNQISLPWCVSTEPKDKVKQNRARRCADKTIIRNYSIDLLLARARGYSVHTGFGAQYKQHVHISSVLLLIGSAFQATGAWNWSYIDYEKNKQKPTPEGANLDVTLYWCLSTPLFLHEYLLH